MARELGYEEEQFPIPNLSKHYLHQLGGTNLNSAKHAPQTPFFVGLNSAHTTSSNQETLQKMLPKTTKAFNAMDKVDVFNLTQGTEQMRKDFNGICYLGECSHRLRMPNNSDIVASTAENAKTFYSA